MTPEELLQQSFIPVPELVHARALERPRHAALVMDERRVAYAELDRLMDRIAAALQRDGVAPKGAIAICSVNSIEMAAVYLGALRAGVAVAPLPPSSTAESIAVMAADSGATHFFADAAHAGLAGPWKTIRLDGLDAWAGEGTPRPVPIQPDWPCNIIYSSGTTGTPKGIVQPHEMRWRHVQRGVRADYGPDAVTLLVTGLYSNTTLVSFFPTLGLGGTVVLMAKFDAQRYLALAEKHRATHTALVPVLYQRLMAAPDFDRYDLSAFRMKTCTSSPFSAELKAQVLARWPGKLVDLYGMTEGGGTCLLEAHLYPHKLHTVGVPVPGHDIRLIDDAGREVQPGEAGEIVGHSPTMMIGYHNQPAKTREAEWFDAAGKRFIRTGDVGRFDADGFLVLVDRKKDMILSGGQNVYPSDLEAVVRQHPEVAEVSVVGVPHEEWGETPIAFVVARSALSPRDLLEWANQRLGKMQRLSAVELVEALPRSAIGKVLKRELRDRWVRR